MGQSVVGIERDQFISLGDGLRESALFQVELNFLDNRRGCFL